MGKELEVKLHLENDAQLQAVLAWQMLDVLRIGERYAFDMETSYFDTADHAFSTRGWTVRRRLENGRSIFCVKTPRDDPAHPLLRGEWEVEAETAQQALPRLAAAGAPEALADFADAALSPVCGAKFRREAQLLRLSRATTCELACDAGVLLGGGREQPFYELELELKSGEEKDLYAFSGMLAVCFGLSAEPKSKYARARALAGL